MTISFGAVGSGTGAGTNSCAPFYPSGITAGQLLLLQVVNKYPNNPPTTPSGWNFIGRWSGGAGSQGVDSGPVYTSAYWKIADGTESGQLTVDVPSGNAAMGKISRWTQNGRGWLHPVAVGGADDAATSTTYAVTGDAGLNLTTGDVIVVLAGINTDGATFTSQSISASGITIGAATEHWDAGTSQGDDLFLNGSSAAVTAGSGISTPSFSMTGSAGTPTGAAAIVRLREGVHADEPLAETVSVNESLDIAMATAAGLSETVALTESAAVVAGLLELVADAVSLSESMASLAALLGDLAESVTVSEVEAEVAGLGEPLSDAVATVEAAVEIIAASEPLVETVALTEDVLGQGTMGEPLLETVSWSDFASGRPWQAGYRGRVRILPGVGDAV